MDKMKVVNQLSASLSESMISLLRPYVTQEFLVKDTTIKSSDFKNFYTAYMSLNCTTDQASSETLEMGILCHWDLKTYLEVASGMLSQKFTNYCEEIDDVGLEMLNMTVGLKKQDLADIGLKLGSSLPLKINGSEYVASSFRKALSKSITLSNKDGLQTQIVIQCFPPEIP